MTQIFIRSENADEIVRILTPALEKLFSNNTVEVESSGGEL